MIDFTPLVQGRFAKQAARMDSWAQCGEQIQARQLKQLLTMARHTLMGRKYDFEELSGLPLHLIARSYAERLPVVEYDDIAPLVMRMLRGERNLLWPGACLNFAQSSGTSGGKSKYIPITPRALKHNHYAGASDSVAAYLRLVPHSRLFSGKALILGGSFANELNTGQVKKGVKVGDLSATLIDSISPLVNLVRIPSKRVALMADWQEKLPKIVAAAARANVTNISGVPSWFLVLLRRLMQQCGSDNLHQVWPNLEVFFHGGISFDPYRSQYNSFTDSAKMHFLENYNASEGFFAVQTDFADSSMTLLLDRDVYFEFAPYNFADASSAAPVGYADLEPGKVYSLIITSSAGLWRYSIGDTVEVTSLNPLKIRIVGRTKSFINAFGEEVMEHNTNAAIARACELTGASVANYTVAPLYADSGKRGRHQWLIEWTRVPRSEADFADALDSALQAVNSDYQAKRAGTIFLDPLQIITAPTGLFDRWLSTSGNGKLGGQRKIPRLSNSREIFESMLNLMAQP